MTCGLVKKQPPMYTVSSTHLILVLAPLTMACADDGILLQTDGTEASGSSTTGTTTGVGTHDASSTPQESGTGRVTTSRSIHAITNEDFIV